MSGPNNLLGSETPFNMLVLDDLNAHYMFLKDKYDKKKNDKVRLFTIFQIEKLDIFLANNKIDMVLVFVYGRRGLYKILDLLDLNVSVVICAHEYDLWWLSQTLTKIDLIDMSLPKEQLFKSINELVLLKRI